MTDKDFIEELKYKRDEYGVAQTRLAVACGISREHYNRIEKGKLPLTEELKHWKNRLSVSIRKNRCFC